MCEYCDELDHMARTGNLGLWGAVELASHECHPKRREVKTVEYTEYIEVPREIG